MGVMRVVNSRVRSVIKVGVSTDSCGRKRDRVSIDKVVGDMVGSTNKSKYQLIISIMEIYWYIYI